MPAYCLFENLEITDPALLEQYKAQVGPIVARHGGRYLVLGGRTDPVEGDWTPGVLVMIEFPDMESAHAWYRSGEYESVKSLRLAAGRFDAVFVEGL